MDLWWFVGLFLPCSVVIIYFSRNALRVPRSHGFYRFFAFEGITFLILLNGQSWFLNPWACYQIISWILLVSCIIVLIEGVRLLRQLGKPAIATQALPTGAAGSDPTLFHFENTTQLVTTGLYRFIRHPLYASLLFLGWGTFLKDVNVWTTLIIVFITLFVFLTARADERECVAKFGDAYRDYMRKSKRFIPFLL